MHFLLIMLDIIIMVLISVAFLTLMERKILSYIQIRKGPNKVSIFGLLQPFSDAIKLFSKEIIMIYKSNYLFFFVTPLFSMILMLMLWSLIPMWSLIHNLKMNFLMILCLLSLGVYSMMIIGWSSNSLYSMLGAIRSIAQTISYEVSMIFIMLNLILLIENFNLIYLMFYQFYLWFIFFQFPMSVILMISMLAELNRTPFDLSEGESELVSGFNTEYMSGAFAMIFISEYGMIMFMMFLFSLFYLGGNIYSLIFYIIYMFMLFMIIWIRGTFPRIRYDYLMMLTWKSFLPSSMNYLIFLLSMKYFIDLMIN
nr:NADH dehydrogenase subunit 1 [Sycophaga agraensis]